MKRQRKGRNLKAVVRIDQLAPGDRFSFIGTLWTYLGPNGDGFWGRARMHSSDSISLGRTGYGYNADSICSFKLTDTVAFVPVNPNTSVRVAVNAAGTAYPGQLCSTSDQQKEQ